MADQINQPTDQEILTKLQAIKAKLIHEKLVFQAELEALSLHINWNRQIRDQAEGSGDIESLLRGLKSLEVSGSKDYPLIIPDEARMKVRINSIQQLIQASEQVFDIKFTENSTQKSKGSYLVQHRLKGLTHGLPFDISFISQTVKSQLTISKLSLSSDGGLKKESDIFIERAETTKNLGYFFKSLVRYAELHNQRMKDINTLYRLFPKLIFGNTSIPDFLTFKDSEYPTIELCLVYQLIPTSTSNPSTIIPSIELIPNILTGSSSADIIGAVPSQFHSLVRVKGLIEAMKVIVSKVFLIKAD